MRAIILAGGEAKQLKYVMGRDGSRSLLRFPGGLLLSRIVDEAKRFYDKVVVVSDDSSVASFCASSGCDFVEQSGRGVEAAICSGIVGMGDSGFVTIIYGDIYASRGFIESHSISLLSDFEPTITVTRPLVLRGTFLRLLVDPVSSLVEKVDAGNYVYAGIISVQASVIREQLCSGGMSVHELIRRLAHAGKLKANIWLGVWVDIDTVWDYMAAVRFDLKEIKDTKISSSAVIGRNVVIEGPVVVEPNARIDHCAVIKGPVYLGRNVFVGAHSFIRGSTAIFEGAVVGAFSEIKRSIIYDEARVYSYSYIADSIVGLRAEVKPYTVTLNVPYEGLSGEVVIMSTHPLEKLKVGSVIAAGASTGYRETIPPASIYTGRESS